MRRHETERDRRWRRTTRSRQLRQPKSVCWTVRIVARWNGRIQTKRSGFRHSKRFARNEVRMVPRRFRSAQDYRASPRRCSATLTGASARRLRRSRLPGDLRYFSNARVLGSYGTRRQLQRHVCDEGCEGRRWSDVAERCSVDSRPVNHDEQAANSQLIQRERRGRF